MKKYFLWLPNALTLGNLLMGCVALLYATSGNLADAAIFVGFALLLDFFDGFAARMLGATSPLGKDLDSLSDMVSFGVVPSFMLYGLASHANYDNWVWGNPQWVGYACFAVAIASAYRLAQFNNDSRQEYGFIGLPTPANALFICGLVWAAGDPDQWISAKLTSPYFILSIVVLCAWLPVSKFKLIALKFKSFDVKTNWFRYLLMLMFPASLFLLGGCGVSLGVLAYVSLSMLVSDSRE